MISHNPILYSIGDLSKELEIAGSIAISKFTGTRVLNIACEEDPNVVLELFVKRNDIGKICGDPAMLRPSGDSWLGAIGAWKIPFILLIPPLTSGNIPGIAAAYVSLCKDLRVPLVGLIQLGGIWNSLDRKLDGLPWCGLMPDEVLRADFQINKISSLSLQQMEESMFNIRKRISLLIEKK
ncbi:hypothetical protein [Prochlorococcus marinus]|uniref:hypothetical protein n=1 Tax=Prochlorococcus marinus TaxID=1219 RepID=UPI0022B520FD|nr:hypothetical protein [Prochlorococcus marinus]